MIDGKTEAFETGEIQIVKNGVSGIPVFQMCRIAAKALDENRLVEGVIDFVPSLSKEEIKNWLPYIQWKANKIEMICQGAALCAAPYSFIERKKVCLQIERR